MENARNEYRNYLTLIEAANGAGEKAAQGLISPAQLRAAAVKQTGKGAYGRGDGDFGELARAGVSAMSPLPNSGTAARNFVRTMLGGAVPGAAVGGATSGWDPENIVKGAALGVGLPFLAGRAFMSRPVQGYLGNQVGRALEMSPKAIAIYNRILGLEGAKDAETVGRAVTHQ